MVESLSQVIESTGDSCFLSLHGDIPDQVWNQGSAQLAELQAIVLVPENALGIHGPCPHLLLTPELC